MKLACLICGKPITARSGITPPTCTRCADSPPLQVIRNGIHIGWLSPGPKEIEARKGKGIAS
jgi:hypothetical protein